MRKYNASLNQFRRMTTASTFGSALLLSLLAGCASSSHKAEPAAAPDPITTPAAPSEIRPVADNAAATQAAPSGLSLRDDAPLHYKVRRGDTLWDIAKTYLRDPWQWPELWYNNAQVKNPHLIYPGETLTLVTVDGRTRLTRDSVLNAERLSPQIREEALDTSIPAIPVDDIRNFLRGPRAVSLTEAQKAPYVVAFLDEHISAGSNSDVYVKGLPENPSFSYAVVQIGDAYRDPETHELLGYEAIPAGEAELRKAGQPSTMRLTKSSREVLIADRLLPIEAESFDANFYPHPPKTPIDGRIMSVFDGVSQISQYAIVALNRGSDQGIDPGTVLDIYQAGTVVPDPYGKRGILLPDLYAGVLMVFKVTPKLSYGLVISANRAVHVLDKVKKPDSGQRG